MEHKWSTVLQVKEGLGGGCSISDLPVWPRSLVAPDPEWACRRGAEQALWSGKATMRQL